MLRKYKIILLLLFVFSSANSYSTNKFFHTEKRTFDIIYRFAILGIKNGGTELKAWIPIPASTKFQKLESFNVVENLPYTIVTEPEYGNKIMRFRLSNLLRRGGNEVTIAVKFRITRYSYNKLIKQTDLTTIPQAQLTRFLAPDKLIPIDGKIAAEARQVAGRFKNNLKKARKIYDNIVETVSYEKSGTGWGHGNALYACNARTGNCTDFHSLFIGELRSLTIPSRFVMGLPIPIAKLKRTTIKGYHCWAEFYIKGYGWIPIDASEASKHPVKKDFYFGSLDQNRVQFTIGRDILIPGSTGTRLNYFIYPYVELDKKQYNNVKTVFIVQNLG